MRILVFIAAISVASSSTPLDIVYKWRTVEFDFPNEAARENHIRSKQYIPGTNVFPLDVDVWHGGNLSTVFVTFPKFRQGIPATLATISPKTNGDSHLVQAYPDWSWHSPENCEGMSSVFRTQIDKCGRLWAIDSGMVDLSLPTRRRECQPKLLVFHLPSGQAAGKHIFPESLLQATSLLTNVAVDVRNTQNECRDTFAYVSDTMGFAILVFDAQKNKSWKVVGNSFYPYPPYGLFQTNNVEFNLMDGILGMALGPVDGGDRMLYYHSLASVRESSVPTSVLRNEGHFTTTRNMAYKEFNTSEEARKAQSAAEAFDRNGILFFGMIDNTLNCWNYRNPFTQDNIHEVVKDDTNLQFASGLKVIPNQNGEDEVWMITNRFQVTMVSQLNANEINFRILKGNVGELLRNSKCKHNEFVTFPKKPSEFGNEPISNNGYNKPNEGLVSSGYGTKPSEGFSNSGYNSRPNGVHSNSGYSSQPPEGVSNSGYNRPNGGFSSGGYGNKPNEGFSNSEYNRPNGGFSSGGYGSKPNEGFSNSGQITRPIGGLVSSGYGIKPNERPSNAGYNSRPHQGLSSSSYISRPTRYNSRPLEGFSNNGHEFFFHN